VSTGAGYKMRSGENVPRELSARDGSLRLLIDPNTGLPSGLASDARSDQIPLTFEIQLETDGVEVRGPVGGVDYEHTIRRPIKHAVADSLEHHTAGARETMTWLAEADGWLVRLSASFNPCHPRGEFRVSVAPADSHDALLRNLHIGITLAVSDSAAWRVEAPGNTLRSGVRVDEIREGIYVLTVGGEEGSPGLVAMHRPDNAGTAVLWPFSRSESGRILLEPREGTLRVAIETELAGEVSRGEWLNWGPLYFDLLDEPWELVFPQMQDWYDNLGVATPSDRPRWTEAANILEAQIGYSPFWDNWRYEPYPQLANLRADLDRIADLGVQCIQLMPRQPYPGYTIIDPEDIDTTYWDRQELSDFVREAHTRGIRVILDVLCSCVVDKQAIRESVRAIKQSPYGQRLDEPSIDAMSPIHVSEDIPTCRFVLAFAEDWVKGAPDRHPFLDEHPDWFMRDSTGNVTGVFTHALEIANEEWQEFFIQSCERLVNELGIDGFRFDTPMYNRFNDWSEGTRRHASYSGLASLALYRKMRRRLHALNPDLLLYIEPSSPLFRESVDLTYPYEEAWLIQSVFDTEPSEGRDWRRVRNGRELAHWFRVFRAALPRGSVTAHHIDSHDTFWWPLRDRKWRRDQVGIDATKALLAIYGLQGGAYMTFIGGEEGIEPDLTRLHRLRAELPVIRDGLVDFDAVEADNDNVYALIRLAGEDIAVVLVNTSTDTLRSKVTVKLDAGSASVRSDPAIFDAWNDEWLSKGRVEGADLLLSIELKPYQARVLLPMPPPIDVLANPTTVALSDQVGAPRRS
jgi:glycosidase